MVITNESTLQLQQWCNMLIYANSHWIVKQYNPSGIAVFVRVVLKQSKMFCSYFESLLSTLRIMVCVLV